MWTTRLQWNIIYMGQLRGISGDWDSSRGSYFHSWSSPWPDLSSMTYDEWMGAFING